MWSVVTKCAYLIPHLHIFSDWLITNKSNIQSSVWATLMKLGMWVVMGSSTAHVVCRHQMHICNTSFAYPFWLANNKINQISRVLYGLHWWNFLCGQWCPQVLPMWSVVTKCAYLIPHSNWLMTKNQLFNNWYAYVKSDLRSVPTYTHQKRPTLYILWA